MTSVSRSPEAAPAGILREVAPKVGGSWTSHDGPADGVLLGKHEGRTRRTSRGLLGDCRLCYPWMGMDVAVDNTRALTDGTGQNGASNRRVPGAARKTSRRRMARERAITALITSPTIMEAAKVVGVDERTVRRWLTEPEFAAAYRAAREKTVEDAVGMLQVGTSEAVQTLRRNLACGIPGVEVKAAEAILSHHARWAELNLLHDRIAALEERQRLIEDLR